MSRPQRVTISDVAARAGVAISSVSSALNGRPGVSEATRARIVQVAQEMGFVPSATARSLSGNLAYAVGLVVHRSTDVLEQDPFFATFIAGVERCIDPRGYGLVLQMGSDDASEIERYRKLAAARRVDGVFLNELRTDDPRIALVQELGLPAVEINPASGAPLPAVRQDGEQGIRDAVAHLGALGHRSVAFLSGPPQFVHSGQRLRAWQAACAELGVVPGPEVTAGFTFEDGARAARQLLARDPRPTAVLCVNDLSAMGLISEAREMGVRVPRDLSVVGYDGVKIAALTRPALTSVVTTPAEVGYHAAELLLRVIQGQDVVDVELPPAQFVVRASTGPAPL